MRQVFTIVLALCAVMASAQLCYDPPTSIKPPPNVMVLLDSTRVGIGGGVAGHPFVVATGQGRILTAPALGTALFGTPAFTPAPGTVTGLAVADLDGDGLQDIVVCGSDSAAGSYLGLC